MTKLTKSILIICVVFAIVGVIGIIVSPKNTRSQMMVVRKVQGEVVMAQDDEGKNWVFYQDYEGIYLEGDSVTLTFDTQGTSKTSDDSVINVKYNNHNFYNKR